MLILDDEAPILRALTRSLRHAYEVTTTTSPEMALVLATSGVSWDIVLSDVTMPVMSGIEFAQRAVHARPALAGHIVLMTGGADTDHILESCGLPIVTKPIDLSNLLAALERVTPEVVAAPSSGA